MQSSRETCAWHPNFEHHALTLRCETALAVGQGSREERQALPSRDVPQQTGQGSVLGHLPRQKFQLGNQAFSWSGKGCGGVNKLVPLSAWRGPHELNQTWVCSLANRLLNVLYDWKKRCREKRPSSPFAEVREQFQLPFTVLQSCGNPGSQTYSKGSLRREHSLSEKIWEHRREIQMISALEEALSLLWDGPSASSHDHMLFDFTGSAGSVLRRKMAW